MNLAVNGRFLTQRLTGAPRYAHEVTRRLRRQEGLADLAVYAPKRELAACGAPVTTTGRLGGHAWEQLELPGALGSADLLWSPSNAGPLTVRRQVVTVHDLFSLRPGWVGGAYRAWYGFLLPRLLRNVRHVIAVSQYTKRSLLERFELPESRVTVIKEGVDPQFQPAGEDELARVRRLYDLPETFLLCLGSLEPRKNLRATVEAWASLPAAQRPPLLIAGGAGPARVFGRQRLDDLQEHRDLRFLGYVPDQDLAALYSAATLFVYASLEEGFGLPPLEAAACGTAVVTSATSALEENCSPWAVLVDPLRTDAIRDGLQRALHDAPPIEERLAISEHVRTRFDWERTAADTARLLCAHG